jgi:hypothetical protein
MAKAMTIRSDNNPDVSKEVTIKGNNDSPQQ